MKNDFIYTGVLLLGTNLGDKTLNIQRAITSIERFSAVLARSSSYESEAWGYSSEETYINVAVKIQFSIDPKDAMQICLEIEQELGRTRSASGYSDRTIDIDFLCIDGYSSKSSHLTVPHPRLNQRLFALLPLQEVYPDYRDQDSGMGIQELVSECQDLVLPTRL